MQGPPGFRKISSTYRTVLGFAVLGAVLAGPLQAGSTGQTVLHMPQGNTAGTADGDFVTTTVAMGGLNSPYHYWIEVPPGLGTLVVEVWDADIGVGAAADEAGVRDRARGTYNTTVTYTLLRPDGTTAATVNCSNTLCTDNAWNTILSSSTAQNTAAGHWELRVTMGGGDDINAIGVRAHDGNSGAGGTELNVYVDSIVSVGVHPPSTGTNTQSYVLYPYLTSGCSASKNDFDYDSNNGNTGSVTFKSRSASFTKSFASASLSVNDTWRQDTFTGWTSDQKSADYGIWELDATINSYVNAGAQNGNYADIFVANYQAATTAPTANPPANSFRLYVANDAGSAPSKPYLDQTLTFTGCGAGNNGPNPPAVGSTSCYTNTVRVVNPAAQAITFSTPTNIVTANIPGAGAVYAGGAQLSQGSIVAQPAVGGTGNITWNPGSVAAGATALLSYRVKVTPASAGQRLPVTATPASGNGTRAQFVDTTGAAQARATYLFGPLCELATTVSVITEAVVSDLHARPGENGGVEVEWRTASEAGTAGYYLERRDRAARRWVPVSEQLLPAIQNAPQGGVYRLLDEGVSPLEPQVYRLQEVQVDGGRRLHGPFAVAVDWQEENGGRPAGLATGPSRAFTSAAHPASRRVAALTAVAAGTARPTGDTGDKTAATVSALHLDVPATGLYYLRAADVAAGFGADLKQAQTWISEGKLNLSRDGQPAAWFADVPAGAVGKVGDKDKTALGLFFYAQTAKTLYADGAVYRLARGNGLVMQTAAVSPAPGGGDGSFPETLHVEQDTFPASALPLDPESDYWFWDFMVASDPTYGHRSFALDAPGLSAGAATLAVSLQGATDSGVAGEHHVQVALNGTLLGDTTWQGIAPQQVSFPLPAGLLLESGNQVVLTADIGGGAPYSIVYLESFDLAYQRAFHSAGDALAFTSGGAPRIGVTGFSSSAVRLLDVADPLRPRWITGAVVESVASPGATTYRLGFVPTAGAHYLAAAPAAFKAPSAVRPWRAPSLLNAGNRADYVVIAPAALHGAAQRLADLRSARGLATLVVDLEQIWDEQNGGSPNPHAIKSFLAWAWANWSRPPHYVVLAGNGTLDYRNLLGYGDNLVPPLMVGTHGGLFPSDGSLADFNGDGVPEIAVGRLPILSAAELDAYTQKITAYEAGVTADWAQNVLMLSDNDDNATSFAAGSSNVTSELAPPYTATHIDLSVTPLAAARTQLFSALAQGASLVNYLGHGGLDRLSAGGLLTNSDVPALTNGSRLPVLTAMTCTINRFAVPGFPSLGALLVESATGGAAAVWAPSGLADNSQSLLLAKSFYQRIFDADDALLGDRLLRSIAEYSALGGDVSLVPLYSLLGDPALRLRRAPAPAITGGGSGE